MLCRSFTYLFSLGHMIYAQVRNTVLDVRSKNIMRFRGWLPIPRYLLCWKESCSLTLCAVLTLMFGIEPIIFCLQHSTGDFAGSGLFSETCPQAQDVRFWYTELSMVATVLYCALLLELAVCSTTGLAFVLVCGRLLPELFLLLGMLAFVILMFATSISALDHHSAAFAGIDKAAFSLSRLAVHMFYPVEFQRELNANPFLYISVLLFVMVAVLLLLNVLTCQVISSYRAAHQDMVGIARLSRAKVIMETMPYVPARYWNGFIESLHLEKCSEFNEGDVGLPGCIEVDEPVVAGEVVEDTIRRFGGNPETPWPKADLDKDEPVDKLTKLEKLLRRAIKRMADDSGGIKKLGSDFSGTSGGSSISRSSC